MRNTIDASTIVAQSPSLSKWKKIELTIRDNLQVFENGRKFCAYCGLNEITDEENSNSNQKCLILGRCYGCQMVYYCSQEHQHLDWLEQHMPKCAELEWVALCELIQSIPASPALTQPGMYWPRNYSPQTWTDWFTIRDELVQVAKQTAEKLEKNCFSSAQKHNQINIILNKLNRREPTVSDLVDGLLAAVTDSITYALTIGNALKNIGVEPSEEPVCIHLLQPPIELLEELSFLIQSNSNVSPESLEQSLIDQTVKKRFYELMNMFEDNRGIEIVFISTETFLDNGVDWCKLMNPPFMKAEMHKSLPLADKNLFISAWHGSYSNYIRYACQIEGYALPDLVVTFHPSFTSSPQKLINDWTDDLKVILNNKLPCLLTFSDSDEKQKAYNILNAFQSNFVSVESNQFSSLMLKQMATKPNHVYAANSFYIVIDGFANVQNDLRHSQIANEVTKRSKSINDILTSQKLKLNNNCADQTYISLDFQHHDACVQTLGLEEPSNPSLRQVKGRLQINKAIVRGSSPNSFATSQYHSTNPGTTKFHQIKMISNNHLDTDNIHTNRSFPPRAPKKKQRLVIPEQYDKLEKDALYPHLSEANAYYGKPTPIPPPFDLNTFEIQPNRSSNYDSLAVSRDSSRTSSSIRFVDDSSVCGSEITLSGDSAIASNSGSVYNNGPIRPRRASLPSNNLVQMQQEISPVEIEPVCKIPESIQLTPSAKPRVNNFQTTSNSYRSNREILDDLSKSQTPITKPRAMKPTRLVDKYSIATDISLAEKVAKLSPKPEPLKEGKKEETNLIQIDLTANVSDLTSVHISSNKNPLPKPRNSNYDMVKPLPITTTTTSNDCVESESELTTDSGHQSSETEILPMICSRRYDYIEKPSDLVQPTKKNQTDLELNYIKTNLIKSQLTTPDINNKTNSENKLTDFLKSRTGSASSSSPSSSSSVLSSTSSPRSEEPTSSSQAVISYSSISTSSSYKSPGFTQSPIKKPIETTSGIVSQMKNIFENHQNLAPISETAINRVKRTASASSPVHKATSDSNTIKNSIPFKTTEPESEYINVSNKYLIYMKSKEPSLTYPEPPPCPPLPPILAHQIPPLPSSSPPPLSPQTVQKNLSMPAITTDNLVAKLISKPPEAPNHTPNTQIQTITTLTQHHHTTLTTTTTTTQLSSTSSNVNNGEFRILANITNGANSSFNDRSSISGRSMGSVSQTNISQQTPQQKMLNHIPSSVDVINFQYEGQRQIHVPGFMTSADILRNMLLKQNTPVDQSGPRSASIIVQQQSQQSGMTLKEKLLMQQNQQRARQDNGLTHMDYNHPPTRGQSQPVPSQSQILPPPSQPVPKRFQTELQKPQQQIAVSNMDDDDLDRKFSKNAGCRARSLVALDVIANDVIDIDLDSDDTKIDEPKPVSTLLSKPVEQYSAIHKIDDIMGPPVALPIVDRTTRPNFNDSSSTLTKTSYVNKYKQQGQTHSQEISFATRQQDLIALPRKPDVVALPRQPDVVALPRQPDVVALPRQSETVSFAKSGAKTSSIRISQLINDSDNRHTSNQKNSSGRVASNRRQTSLLNRSNHEQGVTGSFDASDFDSFDEDEDGNRSYRSSNLTIEVINSKKLISIEQANRTHIRAIPQEPMEKIREEALQQQRIEEERIKQAENMVQFDPDDFDSFDEEEFSRASRDKVESEAPAELINEILPNIQIEQAIEEPTDDCRHSENFISNRNRIEAMFKNNNVAIPVKESIPRVQKAHFPERVAVDGKGEEDEIFLGNNENISNELESQIYHTNQHDSENNYTSHNNRHVSEQYSDYPNLQEDQPNKYQPEMTIGQFSDHKHQEMLPTTYESSAKPTTGFFRSALERMSGRSRSKSSKSRSSSVPLRKYMLDNNYNVPSGPVDLDQLSTATSTTQANMKTLQLMTKIQNDLDEKNKRKQQRQRLNQLELMQKKRSQISKSTNEIDQQKTPNTDRKFLSSIINTLFSSGGSADTDSNLQKNEARRLSLRKLKAKDKMKKRECGGESYYDDQFDGEENTRDKFSNDTEKNITISATSAYQQPFNRSTSFDNGSALCTVPQFRPTSIGATSIGTRKFGKIKNESECCEELNENRKGDIMKQLKAELDEEVKDRRLHEIKQNIISGNEPENYRKSTAFEDIDEDSQGSNRKIRSKSVTFLDELSTSADDDSRQNSNLIAAPRRATQAPAFQPRASIRQSFENRQKQQEVTPLNGTETPSSCRKISLKNGDARLMCGALTGAGPIRSIMKKSATDLSIGISSPQTVQKRALYESQMEIEELNNANYGHKRYGVADSQTIPNLTQMQNHRKEIMQSDL